VETARARLQEAEANSEKAQADLERYKTLIAKEEVSKQEFDAVASAAKAQAAGVSAAKGTVESDLQIVNQKRALVAQSQSRLSQYQRNAPAELAVRRAAVVSEQASAKTADVQVEKAKLNLAYTKVTAPVNGIVMKRSAEVGMHVAAGQQLLTVAQTEDLWVTANFKENATGNFVKVVQRIPVRIRFNKNQTGLERLRPGMSVEPEVRVMD
jgi:membrane fusion protein (multidrug efflux system)